MTAEQEDAWSTDANCYVVDEDVDAFGARSSCEMLLSELQVSSTSICLQFHFILTSDNLR